MSLKERLASKIPTAEDQRSYSPHGSRPPTDEEEEAWNPYETDGAEPARYRLTDLGNAERFADQHHDTARYCHPWSRWLVWDGTRWEPDESGSATGLATETVRAMYREAAELPDDEYRKALAKHATSCEGASRIKSMLNLTQHKLAIQPDELDHDPWLFNVQNGTVDLRTGELRPHRQQDLITNIAPVRYDPDAHTDLWDTFLQRIFDGDNDLIGFVQRWLGYRLTGTITAQLLPIFWGVGNNGKSTLLDLILEIMGDYADEAPPNLLTQRRGGDEHPCEIADLAGKRLIVASENEKGRKLRLQLMKMLTGNARLKGRFNRKDYFSFDRTFEPVLVTNNKPRIREDTEAVWRRVRLVPFSVVIPKDERDPDLMDKLKQEAPGILRWLVDGCLAWQQQGLYEPEAIQDATTEYRDESDPLHEFIDQCCILAPEMWTKTKDLRDAYERYCDEQGDRPAKGQDFRDSLRKRGCVSKRRHSGWGWLGIGILTDQEEFDYETSP